MDADKVIGFHNPEEEYGFLSNWYPSEFCMDGIRYFSLEQYMMYQKAILFEDKKNAEKILLTNVASVMKVLGRKVKNYEDSAWNGRRQVIVYRGLIGKFGQNPELKEKLLETGDAILAECAVKDRIWGIGLSMKDPRRFDLKEWKGQNLLGYTLMEVRSEIRKFSAETA